MADRTRDRRSPLEGRRRPSLNVILTAVVVVIAVGVIGAVLLFNDSGSGDGGEREAPSQTLIPRDAHALTRAESDSAPVTLVEFLDFQCPACAGFYDQITAKLERDYQGRITFVPRPFPLDSHPLADVAARAAEAAGKQGKFAQMYHRLYGDYRQWAVDGQSLRANQAAAVKQFERYATDIGLDLRQFRTDLDSAAVRATVDRGIADGTQLGVDSTPTFFVDGRKFEPSGDDFASVDRQLRAELDAALAE